MSPGPEDRGTKRVVSVVLADRRGWLLLQERDEHAPTNPDEWSMVGGAVEPGETDEAAAYRELVEETEVTGVDLTHVASLHYFCVDCRVEHDLALYLALTDLTDDDVVCHEGRQIVFVDPTSIDGLRWASNLAHGLPLVMTHPSYVERFGRLEPHGFGCVLLVNGAGDVLLQERDEHAPIDPDRWGLSGGHLEPGETPEAGAYREVAEETGVRLEPGTLEPWAVLDVFHPHYGSVDQVHVYAGRVDLTDSDIDCREGRQIVFVPPDRALGLRLTTTGVLAVPAFLASDTYRRLAAPRDAAADPSD
jgi:8-oxo-dGTP pyrophosphatase MutT (NUDIX family)